MLGVELPVRCVLFESADLVFNFREIYVPKASVALIWRLSGFLLLL